jgi:predicted CoA-binding protein
MASSEIDQNSIKKLLSEVHTIAVVGISSNPSRDSYLVADYLKRHGYRVIPVNPAADEILGERSYPDLKSVPEPIDVVDVFRRPEHVPAIAEQAGQVGAKVFWMQFGAESDEAAKKAEAAGMTVVQGRCMMQEHSRLLGK